MGHIRLGNLPKTRKWQQVVDLIEGGAGTAQVANATITAAERGLKLAALRKPAAEAKADLDKAHTQAEDLRKQA